MENIKSSSHFSLKNVPKIIWPILSIFISLVLIVFTALYVIPSYINANETGEFVGSNIGKTVGKALGSFNGITKGLNDGYNDGKKDGLSAKDTEVEISNAIQNGGKLEILSAKVQLTDFMEAGQKYAALYMFRGNVIFSVDLSKASVSTASDGKIIITIPIPTAEVTIDDSETQTIAERQKNYFNGKAEDGFDAFINSHKEIKSNALEKIENYNFLLKSAKESVTSQIEAIASNICGYAPEVVFKEA